MIYAHNSDWIISGLYYPDQSGREHPQTVPYTPALRSRYCNSKQIRLLSNNIEKPSYICEYIVICFWSFVFFITLPTTIKMMNSMYLMRVAIFNVENN